MRLGSGKRAILLALHVFQQLFEVFISHPLRLQVTSDPFFTKPEAACFIYSITVCLNLCGAINVVVSRVEEFSALHELFDVAQFVN